MLLLSLLVTVERSTTIPFLRKAEQKDYYRSFGGWNQRLTRASTAKQERWDFIGIMPHSCCAGHRNPYSALSCCGRYPSLAQL